MSWTLLFLHNDSPKSVAAFRQMQMHGNSVAHVPLQYVDLQFNKYARFEEDATPPVLIAKHENGTKRLYTGPFDFVPTLRFVCTLAQSTFLNTRQRSFTC